MVFDMVSTGSRKCLQMFWRDSQAVKGFRKDSGRV